MGIYRIAGWLMALSSFFLLVSCFDDAKETEPSTSHLLTSFALSTDVKAYTTNQVENANGELVEAHDTTTTTASSVKFTIDQINRTIYNRDSLPCGSDLRKMTVSIGYAGAYVARQVDDGNGALRDTAWTNTDSLDLTRPAYFKVVAYDETSFKVYTVKVNVHTVDPDSMIWQKRADMFSGGKATGDLRTVVLGENIVTFCNAGGTMLAYANNWKTPSQAWTETDTSIKDANINSICAYNGQAYMATTGGEVYVSADGTTWSKSALSGNVATFVGTTTYEGNDRLVAITADDKGTRHFAVSDDGQQWSGEASVPDGFPADNFSGFALPLSTNSSTYRLNVMGRESESDFIPDSISAAWFTLDGLEWADMVGASTYRMPRVEKPIYLYYADSTYAFGYGKTNKMTDMYVSQEYGVVWHKSSRKVTLPYEFEGRSSYSAAVTPDNRLWVFFGKTEASGDEVWCGRVNRLGFATD